MFQQRNSFEPCKSKDRLHCHHICAVSNCVNIKSIIIAKRINTGSHPGGVNVTVSKNRPSQSAQWAGRARRSKSTLHFVHKSGNMTQFVLRFIISISRLAEIPSILPCRTSAGAGPLWAITVVFLIPPEILISSHLLHPRSIPLIFIQIYVSYFAHSSVRYGSKYVWPHFISGYSIYKKSRSYLLLIPKHLAHKGKSEMRDYLLLIR
jgi:hypothetical protein